MASASARVIWACGFLAATALAGSASAAQDDGCSGAIAVLSPCLRFLEGSGSVPLASCCSALGAVGDGVGPRCVFTALSGINIVDDRALELHKGCTNAGRSTPRAESDVLIIFAAALAFLFMAIAVVDVYSEQTKPRIPLHRDRGGRRVQ